MFAPLPTPHEMAAWDKAAVDLGMPELLLMEHAGRAAAAVLAATYGPVEGKSVLLFMGAGNNGGDAACLARLLRDAGADVLVLHTRPLSAYKGVTGQHLRLSRRCGVPFAPATAWSSRFRKTDWARPQIVVDGLLGTGFSGHLREQEASLVKQINSLRLEQGAFVLALDIPSGLDGLTGRPCPEAVRADATATFAAAKPGLMMPEAAAFVGSLQVCDIAMPRPVREALPPSCFLMLPAILDQLPQPGLHWHKGRAGHVLVVGGSAGLTGAPHLAALGALRSGAGLVTVAAPEPLAQAAKGSADIMSHALGATWNAGSASLLADLLGRVDALVLGPGIGRSDGAIEAVAAILALPDRPPTVIDADALYTLSRRPELAGCVRPGDVLTPHPGEAASILGGAGSSAASVQEDRLKALRALMERAAGVWVLKAAGTLVGRRGGSVALCPVAAPNLAVAGSGDVLAGAIGTLLAQGLEPFMAACCGVYLHARSGELLAEQYPRRGNSASEIADMLPVAGAVTIPRP